jgi:hypothetical protein
MTDLQKIQQAAQAYYSKASKAKLAMQQANAKLKFADRDFSKKRRGLDAENLDQEAALFTEKRNELSVLYDGAKAKYQNTRDSYLKDLKAFLPRLNPVTAIEELNDNYPILLFPLRLEIRFKIINSQHQLWLRVYPDDCNVQHNESLLSESELRNVQQFWIELWKAGGVESAERGAWTSLVNSHGSGRAAYLITEYKPTAGPPVKADDSQQFLIITSDKVLTAPQLNSASDYWIDYWLANEDVAKIKTAQDNLVAAVGASLADEINRDFIPDNITDKVPEGIVKSKVFVHRLDLPDYTPKASSWSEAPVAVSLPDKFVCILTKGATQRTEIFTHGVSDHLPVGPDPSLPEEEQVKKDANGNLIVNEDLQWMVDFDKAMLAGMATKINLTAAEYSNGFNSLKVIGIRFRANESQGKTELESLFTNHFYSKDGFGLLKQGTPTNNTEDLPAGYSWIDDPDDSYERIFKNREDFNATEDLEKKSDGERLADALGIDPSILKLVPNANGKDQLEANAMNKALFPATMGYFMEEMMHPLFTDNDIDNTKQFFASYVSGRGPIPAIRIGKQPYGILPVSVYSRLNFSRSNEGFTGVKVAAPTFIPRLYGLLMKLDAEWNSFVSSVPHVGQPGGDPHQTLLDVIGLHANSAEYHQRYAQTLTQFFNQIALTAGPLFGALIAAGIAERGKTILTGLGINTDGLDLPILRKFFFGKPNRLNGPLVDDVPDSETTPVRDYSVSGLNYIEWLAASDANTVRIENFGGNDAPTALLYILLRHSLMQSQSDAAARVLVAKKKITDKSVCFDPDLIHVEADGKGRSKFEHLYSNYPDITGNDTMVLAEHIYRPEVLALRKETIRLNETIEALKVLEQTPTARLERLLTEHLDCCNYRLDAWITALVNFKLQVLRKTSPTGGNEKSKGIYLGAYGWLLDVKPENKVLQAVPLSGELGAIFNPADGSSLMSDNTNLGFIHAPSLNQAATAAILRNAYDSNKSAGSGNPFAINLSSDRVRIAGSFLEGIRNGQSLSALLGYHFERGLHDKYSLGQGEVDKFIYPLRKVFPLVANKLADTSDDDASIESIEARNVIDGLKFIQHVQANAVKTYPYGIPAAKGLPAATAAQAKAIDDELKAIMAINDSVSDLVIAEQVYQTVKGNMTRAAGNADAFSKGGYPPDVEVMNTPRTGTTLTHRVGLQLNAMAAAAVGAHPRTSAEPALSEWLVSIFPSPANVLCKVTYSSPVTPETTITVSQQDIGLDAMDLIYVLQTDTAQAMSEIDDRIVNHVRYSLALHPDTKVFIRYTDIIDVADRSKISFFELSSLVGSLRKIIRGNRYLQPSHLALSSAGETVMANFNDALLKQRIQDRITAFQLALNNITALQAGAVSIASLTEAFNASVQPHNSDATFLSNLGAQMETDIKAYVRDNTAEVLNKQLVVLETTLGVIGNPANIASLKTQYGNALDSYIADLANIDGLVQNACTRFQEIALFKQQQTGTGFMHQVIQTVYKNVLDKTQVVIDRWIEKQTAFATVMAGYNPAGDPGEQFKLLQSAEQIISVEITTSLAGSIADYKNNIDVKKNDFDALLLVLQSHASNTRTKVTDFIQDVEISLATLSTFDAIKFDQKEERNDLSTEKVLLAQLKEDIVTAFSNILGEGNKAIADCNKAITDADALVNNTDKINALLKAGQLILGDEALLIPQFTLDTDTGNEFEKAYNAGTSEDLLQFAKTTGKHLLPVEDWLGGVARVKAKVHEWEHISFLTPAFKAGKFLDLVPLQFPYATNDRWLALKFRDETNDNSTDPMNPPDTFKISGDKLLYSTHFATAFNKVNPQCGIIIDDWTEVIPNETETTGISFHYDQPNSEPPQTMLLVTAPQHLGHWQWKDLVDATLQLAKKRAVEPKKLEGSNYGQFLPSTMMAVSFHWITVATNLSMNNQIYQYVKTT